MSKNMIDRPQPLFKEQNIYLVQSIIKRKLVKGKFQYLVKWEGYPLQQATWEPRKNLEIMNDIVEQFDREWEEKIKQKSVKNKKNKPIKNKKQITIFKNIPSHSNKKMKIEPQTLIINQQKEQNFYQPQQNIGKENQKPKAKKVQKIKGLIKNKNQMMFQVEWENLQGYVFNEGLADIQQVKKNQPDKVIEFYEKRIQIINEVKLS